MYNYYPFYAKNRIIVQEFSRNITRLTAKCTTEDREWKETLENLKVWVIIHAVRTCKTTEQKQEDCKRCCLYTKI